MVVFDTKIELYSRNFQTFHPQQNMSDVLKKKKIRFKTFSVIIANDWTNDIAHGT